MPRRLLPLAVLAVLLSPHAAALVSAPPGVAVAAPQGGPVAVDPSGLPPTPQPGVTVVAGRHVVQDARLDVAGDLVVAPGGELVLRRSTLAFEATPDRHPTLRVLPGARLVVDRSTITTAATGSPESRAVSWFHVDVQGEALVRDSLVEHAREVAFEGPGAVGVVEDSTLRHFAGGFVTFARGATGTLARNHVHSNFDYPVGGPRSGAVLVADTAGVTIRDNLFEDVLGQSVVAVQASGVGSFAVDVGATVEGNLFYDSSPRRHPAGEGTWLVFADGAVTNVTVRGNALAAALVGVVTAHGAGPRVTGNDALSIRPPGLAFAGADAGFHVSGSTTVSRGAYDPTFEANRLRGFPVAVRAVNGAWPTLSGNSLDASNALAVESNTSVVDARRNWWGPDGPAARVTGPVDATLPLDTDPWAARALDVVLALDEGNRTLVLTVANRLDAPLPLTLFVRNAPGAPSELDLVAGVGETTLRVPLTDLPPAGTDAVVLARAAGVGVAVAGVRSLPS